MADAKKSPARRNIIIAYAVFIVGYILLSFAVPLITSRAELVGYDTVPEKVHKYVAEHCGAGNDSISDFSEPEILSDNDTNIMCIRGSYTLGSEKYNYYAWCKKLPFFDSYYLDRENICSRVEDDGNSFVFWASSLLFKGRIYIPVPGSKSELYINEEFNYLPLFITISFVIAFCAVPNKQKSNT